MAKKKPIPKKRYDYEFRIQGEDGQFYSDSDCTQPASSPEDLEKNGWEKVEDDPVNNPQYPRAKRRIKLRKHDTSGEEPLGIYRF